MINDMLAPGSVREERACLIFFSIVICFALVDAIIIYSSDSSFGTADSSTLEWLVEFDQDSFSQFNQVTLSDGDSEQLTSSLEANWSEDGWKVQRIIVRINYDETSFADNDCDTVTGEVEITQSTGSDPIDSVEAGSISDCSELELRFDWAVPSGNINAASAEAVRAGLELSDAPISVDVDFRLNCDSTIPGNDNDEQIEVDIEIFLVRVISIEPA